MPFSTTNKKHKVGEADLLNIFDKNIKKVTGSKKSMVITFADNSLKMVEAHLALL